MRYKCKNEKKQEVEKGRVEAERKCNNSNNNDNGE